MHTSISSKTEAAMFLAQIMHESIGLKFKKEIACQNTGCPDSYHITPGIGIPGKFYYGRGYIQLVIETISKFFIKFSLIKRHGTLTIKGQVLIYLMTIDLF